MICKGIRHEEGVPETCASISLCDDMASMCVARWDRRKQANPKRTNNVDDIPLEADLHDPDNVQTADTTGHTSGQNDVLTSGNPQPEASDNNDKSDETNDRQMAPLSEEPVVTEIGDDVRAASPTPSNVRQDDVTDDVTTTSTSPATTTTTTNGYHGSQAEERAVSMVTEEDENIQELMGRSDTVVIFPEPVSDHEEGNNTTENEGDLDEDLAKCPHCERAYPQLELLKEHWHGAHAGQTSKHCCPQCGISFLTKGHLDKHIALHSPSAQICKICRKTFANVYRLQRHMISHEESTELRKFKCPECQKAFKFKHHLKEHIRIHSGEKPFECQNCGKRFSHSGSYSSHMTSKKCWIVNMKMRSSASVGRLDKAADGSGQTLVPKTLENNVDMNLASMMYGSGLLGQRFLPYAGAQFQAPYIGQMNGAQSPFLSPNPLTSAMSTTIIPGLTNVTAFGCLPPGCADKEAKVSGSQSETAAGSASPSQQVKDTDENMNRKMKSEGETATEPRTSTTATTTAAAEGQRTEQGEIQVKVKTEPNPEGGDTSEKTATGAGQHDHKQQQQQQGATDDDTTEVGAKSESGEDGSHTLTALASAATQQLQQLMKESKCCDVKAEPKTDGDKDSEAGGQASHNTCKYCRQEFASPISLHQHERYLCKQNEEIRHGEVPAMPNGALCSTTAGSHDEATDECSESERKIRVRSMITDEQVQILKSFYQTNQRPNKFELETLAQQIGFPKRVVQVWFQNMRARDRRKGRTVRDGKPTGGSIDAQHVSSSSGAVGYIPIVPQVSPPAALGNYYTSGTVPKTTGPTAALYNTSASPQRACEASFEAEQPLDLTVKVPQAHTSKPYSSQPDPPGADEVLNLSVKDVSSHPNKENSPTPATVAEHALPASCKPEDRQPTGGSTGPHDGTRSSSDGSTGPPVALVVPVVSVPPQINTTPAHSNSYASMTSMPYRLAFNQTPSLAHHHQQYENGAKPASYEPGLPLASSPSLCSGELMSPRPNSLDSSFNTGISLESNPDTAAAAAATFRMSQKTKRPRKKSWRQVGGAVESEEMQDLDESVDEDSDSPLRKKRRSWKQHRVDVAEGLYACDQCDKMFSKQSSLARHKYEHSGQRPFPCDICTKAFKHKHHLTEHKRLHSGEKPFQCQKCGKRFSHSGSYSQHMNHRYKYCKPLLGDDCDNGEVDMETEHSEASP